MGKKKVTGEDGKTYVMKEKKPIFKKWWFWVIIVVLVIAIGANMGGGDKDKTAAETPKTTGKSETTKESTAEKEENKAYGIGDTVKVGDAEYTLTGVELTDKRNEFADEKPAEVVKISYTIKNVGKTDLPVGLDLDVYSPDDKKAESYPNDNTMGSVASGKSMDCVEHFGINGKGEIEIQFAPAISFEDAAIFKATVE